MCKTRKALSLALSVVLILLCLCGCNRKPSSDAPDNTTRKDFFVENNSELHLGFNMTMADFIKRYNVPSPQGKQRSLIALRTIQAIISIGVFLLLLFCAYKLFCNALDTNFFSFS